jgi:hypothetical protein
MQAWIVPRGGRKSQQRIDPMKDVIDIRNARKKPFNRAPCEPVNVLSPNSSNDRGKIHRGM